MAVKEMSSTQGVTTELVSRAQALAGARSMSVDRSSVNGRGRGVNLRGAVPRFGGNLLSGGGACCRYEPSELAALLAEIPPTVMRDMASDCIAPLVNYNGMVSVRNADYASLGSVAQLLDAVRVLQQFGAYAPTVTAGAVNGALYEVIITDTELLTQLVLGIRVDWGINLQSYAPVTSGVKFEGFQDPWIATNFLVPDAGAGAHVLNRVMNLRFDGSLGGSFFIPAAYRSRASMTNAVIQPARIDNDHAETPTPPTLTFLGLPATILAAFTAEVQLITAHSQALVDFLHALGIVED